MLLPFKPAKFEIKECGFNNVLPVIKENAADKWIEQAWTGKVEVDQYYTYRCGINIETAKKAFDLEELYESKLLIAVFSNDGEKFSKEGNFHPKATQIELEVVCEPMKAASNKNAGIGTYLVLYGAGATNPLGNVLKPEETHNLYNGPKKSAEAMAKSVAANGVKKNQIHLLSTFNESEFFAAVNKKYKTGKIRELYVYAHGTDNCINLGGHQLSPDATNEEQDIAIGQEDERWISNKDDGGNSKLSSENEILNINRGNFVVDAKIVIRACNVGGEVKEEASESFAQDLADHMGSENKVKAYVGGSEYKQEVSNLDGKKHNVYDGEMIRTADKKTQQENLTTYKPRKKK